MERKRASASDTDACELFLVPADVIKSWHRDGALASIDRPLDTNLASAASDVSSVVREAESGETGETDAALNQRLLSELGDFLRYKKLRDETRGSAPVVDFTRTAESSDNSYGRDSILAKIPASYKTKADKILTRWLADPEVTVDAGTGRVTLGQSPLPGSNIVQLLKHAVSRSKLADTPAGFEPMLRYSKSAGMKQHLFSNQMWRDALSDPVKRSFSPGAERHKLQAKRKLGPKDSLERDSDKTITPYHSPHGETDSDTEAAGSSRGSSLLMPSSRWVSS